MGTAGAVAVRERVAPQRQVAPARTPFVLTPTVAPAPGNRAMGSLLRGVTVQRQGCGGSCGCGGTCSGEGESESKAPDAEELLSGSGATVQRLQVGTAPPRRSSSPPAHLLPTLQQGAGNAAVARLLQGASGGSRPVQRLGVEDLLPDWISGAIFGAKDKAKGDADKAATDGKKTEQLAEHQAEETVAKVDAEAPKVMEKVHETSGKAEETMASGKSTVAKAKGDVAKANADAGKKMMEQAAQTSKASEPAAIIGGEPQSCSLAKVANSVENVADIIGKPFGLSGSALIKKVGALISGVGKAVGKGLKAIADLAKSAKAAYNKADDWVKQKLGVDLATIGKWVMILSNPITAMRELGAFVGKKIGEAAVAAGRKLAALASFAMTEGPKIVNGIKAKIGSWYSSLPAPLRQAIEVVTAPFRAVFDGLQAAGKAIGEKLKPKADAAKGKADDAANKAKAKADELDKKAKADKAAKEGEVAKDAAAKKAETDAKAKAEGDKPAKEGEAKSKDLKAAGDTEADKVAKKVCAELDSSMGPCIKDYLPDPGKGKGEGNSSALTATVAGEVTVPIPETPISAKVGAGSKVEVARSGDGDGKTFTVSITGDSMLYANLGAGTDEKPSLDGKVDLPGGGKGNLAKVWENLGGAAKGPAATPAVAPAGGGGGGDVSAKGDIDMGYRAQSALVYSFTAGKTNCEGLGGLTALLAALGVKGAAGFLGELAMLAAGGQFEKNLTSRKFTVAEGVVMSGEVKNSFAKAGIKVGGEVGATFGQEKKDGKMVDTLELFAGVSGELSGEIEHEEISGIAAGLSGSAQVSVTLGYVKDPATNTEEIDVIKLGAKASGGASIAAVNLSKLESVAGARAVEEVRRALQISHTSMDPTSASIKGDLSVDVEAATAKASLGGILEDPAVASQKGVLDKAKEAIKKTKTTGKASISLTSAERLAGAAVEFEEREPGMNTGAKASASLERSETRVLWAKTF